MSFGVRRLGKYELLEQLGHGGSAEVWKALDTQLQRFVAIKLLHANLKEDPQFIARFELEAQLVAALHHPNIVQIHDFQITSSEKEGTVAYMVMDYVEGQTLADYIRRTAALGNIPSPTEIVQLFTSICLAVDYAHQQGMIHRDLKPANILLDKQNTTRNPMGEPILTDFGLARFLESPAATLTAVQLGTPLYIAPEQVTGFSGNKRSDIYSLGVILYEMVTGRPPFQGANPTAVMTEHLKTAPPSPSLINPSIPPSLEMVIMRCLAKEPTARFHSASALAAAIAEALNVPVPESLGNATFSPDAEYMPTFIIPSPLSLTPEKPPSLPAVPVAKLTDVPATVIPPTGSLYPYPSSASGGQRIFPISAGGGSFTPVQSPAHTPPPLFVPRPVTPGRRRKWLIFSVIAIIIVLLGGLLGAYFLFLFPGKPVPTPSPIVGHAFYVSSGQIGEGAQGIADQLQVDLQNVQAPPPGKSYYLWLLPDKDTTPKPDLLGPAPISPPILLTNNLPVQQDGSVHYEYLGDAQHNNLLSATSRLLITLDNSGYTPAHPSTNSASWIYYAELPQAYIPHDPTGLRGLDHLRHLYYNEDHLQVLALYGGLDVWVLRNTEKLLEWSTSARDDFDGTTKNESLMHTLFISILDYLDGTANVHLDVPPGTPITADPTIAKVSLLTVDSTRQGVAQYLATDPPGDLDHMRLHLSQLNRAPDATPTMHILSQEIIVALDNVKGWLQQVRTDAKELLYMTPNQLAQPAARDVLDDLVTQVTYAYIGQIDPITGLIKPGVLQAHYNVQKLATFDITKNVPKSL